jgi:hypothetical protein
MKKIQVTSLNGRFFRGSLALAAFASLILSGCDLFAYKRPFADAYYDDNFIAAIGFDRFVGNSLTFPSAEPDPVTGILPYQAITGQWDFAYRYDPLWNTAADRVDYMTLAPTNLTAADFGTVPAGLEATSPVYRLELDNLLDGGDLETSTAGWSTDFVSGSSLSLISSLAGINGQSLQMDLTKAQHHVFYTIPSSLIENTGYTINFKWLSSSGDPNNFSDSYVNSTIIGYNTDEMTGTSDFSTSTVNTITFGTISALTLEIDDLTIKKTVLSAQLRLLLAVPETNPPLGPFLYKFTFWVCPDPSVGTYTAPYHLNTLKADMQKTADTLNLSTVSAGYEYGVTGWQKIEVRVENDNLQFNEETGTLPVLELVIDLDDSLPGRILLAQPELRAYPDGY